MGVGGQRHALAALPPGGGGTAGTNRTGGWVGRRTRRDGYRKSRPTEIRSPDRPARSPTTLYQPTQPHVMVRIKHFSHEGIDQ
jgi:hypothetical protein